MLPAGEAAITVNTCRSCSDKQEGKLQFAAVNLSYITKPYIEAYTHLILHESTVQSLQNDNDALGPNISTVTNVCSSANRVSKGK